MPQIFYDPQNPVTRHLLLDSWHSKDVSEVAGWLKKKISGKRKKNRTKKQAKKKLAANQPMFQHRNQMALPPLEIGEPNTDGLEAQFRSSSNLRPSSPAAFGHPVLAFGSRPQTPSGRASPRPPSSLRRSAASPRPDNPRPNSPRAGSPRPNSPRPNSARPNSPRPNSARPTSPRPNSPRPISPRPISPRPNSPRPQSSLSSRSPSINMPMSMYTGSIDWVSMQSPAGPMKSISRGISQTAGTVPPEIQQYGQFLAIEALSLTEGIKKLHLRAKGAADDVARVDFNMTKPTFATITAAGSVAHIPYHARDLYARKCMRANKVLHKALHGVVARLMSDAGKYDYMMRTRLANLGMKIDLLHCRLRGDQFLSFAQWSCADEDLAVAWTWLTKSQVQYNTYASSAFFNSIRDSKEYKKKDGAADKARFLTLTKSFKRLFEKHISWWLHRAISMRQRGRFDQSVAAADAVLFAFLAVRSFHPVIIAFTQYEPSALEIYFDALKMRTIDIRGKSLRALRACNNASTVASAAATKAAVWLRKAQKSAQIAAAKAAAIVAMGVMRFAQVLEIVNEARIAATECQIAYIQCSRAADLMATVIIMGRLSSALQMRKQGRYALAVADLHFVQQIEGAPQVVAITMSKILHGKFNAVMQDFSYEKMREDAWWHTAPAIHTMRVVRQNQSAETDERYLQALQLFKEEVGGMGGDLDRALVFVAAAAKVALQAARTTPSSIALAHAADEIALVESHGQALQGDSHFTDALRRVRAIDAPKRRRFQALQRLYRSGGWNWPCQPRVVVWLEDTEVVRRLEEREKWLAVVLDALQRGARSAMSAAAEATSRFESVPSVEDVAACRIQSFGRELIAYRQYCEIMEMTTSHNTPIFMFHRGLKVYRQSDEPDYFLTTVYMQGTYFRIKAVHPLTGEMHIVPPGDKARLLIGLLNDQTLRSTEISEPIIRTLVEQYLDSVKHATQLLRKSFKLGRIKMFVVAIVLGGTVTITVLEHLNGNLHTYEIELVGDTEVHFSEAQICAHIKSHLAEARDDSKPKLINN